MGIMHNGKMYGLAYKETAKYAGGLFWSSPSLSDINWNEVEPYLSADPSNNKYYIRSSSFSPIISSSVWLEPTDGWLSLSDNWPGNNSPIVQMCFKNASDQIYTSVFRPYVKGSKMCYLSWIDENVDCNGDLIFVSGSSTNFANESTYEKDKNIMCWVPNGNMCAGIATVNSNYFAADNMIMCGNNWVSNTTQSRFPTEEPNYNIYINETLYNALENFSGCKERWDTYCLNKTILFDETETQWLDIPEDGKYVQLSRNGSVVGTIQYWDYNLE